MRNDSKGNMVSKLDENFKRLEGVHYEDEETPDCVFFVKELLKVKDFGNLYLSNYKLCFVPNFQKDVKKL